MQLAFFLSPVIWKPDMLGHWEPLLPINPFYALMETVRGPLMGGTGSIVDGSWRCCGPRCSRPAPGRSSSASAAASPSGSDSMPMIEAAGLTIEFPLYHLGARSLKQRILSSSRLRLRKSEDHRIVVSALRDLTFTVRPGSVSRWSARTAPARPRCCARSPASTSRSPAGCGWPARSAR